MQLKVQNNIKKIFEEHNFSQKYIPNINSCLINYYEDGTKFIPPHKDTHLSFGLNPTIIGISYGDTRIFTIKNTKEKYSFNLESGSMFIMAGSSQRYYTHETEKSNTNKSRFSLTFREFIN